METFPTPLQRYFPCTDTHLIQSESSTTGFVKLHTHLNGLVMMTLQANEIVSSVEFVVKRDPKTKKFFFKENDALVSLCLSSGSHIQISAPFTGEILSVNELLVKQPNLINSDPQGTGHLLFLQPRKTTKRPRAD